MSIKTQIVGLCSFPNRLKKPPCMRIVNIKAEIFMLVVHQEENLYQFLGNGKLCEDWNIVSMGYPTVRG